MRESVNVKSSVAVSTLRKAVESFDDLSVHSSGIDEKKDVIASKYENWTYTPTKEDESNLVKSLRSTIIVLEGRIRSKD